MLRGNALAINKGLRGNCPKKPLKTYKYGSALSPNCGIELFMGFKKRNFLVLLLAAALLLSGCNLPQPQGTLEFSVTSDFDGKPVAGAGILVEREDAAGDQSFRRTNADGKVSVEEPVGSYMATITMAGFDDAKKNGLIVLGGRTNQVGVQLHQQNVPVCGNGTCEVGEDQTNCPQDCGAQNFCNADEKPLPEDTNSTAQYDFYKEVNANFYACDGTVTERQGQKCCLGTINNGHMVGFTYSESRIDAPDYVYIYTDLHPIVNVEIDGAGNDYDCSNNECSLGFEPIFQTPGLKQITATIKNGTFSGRSIAFGTNILEGDEYAKLCDARTGNGTTVAMASIESAETTKFRSTGTLASVNLGGKGYFMDVKKAREYMENNPAATLDELQAITTESTYIVELKQESVLERLSKTSTEGLTTVNARSAKMQAAATQSDIISNIVVRVASQYGLQQDIEARYKNAFSGFAVKLDNPDAAEKLLLLENDADIKKIYPNMQVHSTLDKSVPFIKADKVWAKGLQGEGIRVGIIDTGIDYTHPDLGGCLGQQCKVKGGKDFINNDNDPMDDMGHGTHVAATVASDGQLKGVAPKASLYGAKVLDSSGSGSWGTVIAGIDWAVDPNNDGDFSDKMDVINLSLGGYGYPDDPVSAAIDMASQGGIVPVVAAGNNYRYLSIGSPGTARKAITVAAAWIDENQFGIADFSSRGPYIDENIVLLKPEVAAPGVEICAAEFDSAWSDRKCFDDKHISISGTSMATPHVAGVAALLKQQHPNWTPAQIKSAIVNNAVPNKAYDQFTEGAGIVDAEKAYNAKIIFTPAVVSIGHLHRNTAASVEIENVSGGVIGIVLPQNITGKKTNLLNGEVKDINVPLEVHASKTCLQAGEVATLAISVDPVKSEYGLFPGTFLWQWITIATVLHWMANSCLFLLQNPRCSH